MNCCVLDCKHSKKSSPCTFKRFPTDAKKRKLWENAVSSRPGASEWKKSAWNRICECHFDDDQFERNRQDGFCKLRWDAVPSLFGSRAKYPSHRIVEASNKPSKVEPGVSYSREEATVKTTQKLSSMSSEEVVSMENEGLGESEDQQIAEDEQLGHTLVTLTDNVSEADSVPSTADDVGADCIVAESESNVDCIVAETETNADCIVSETENSADCIVTETETNADFIVIKSETNADHIVALTETNADHNVSETETNADFIVLETETNEDCIVTDTETNVDCTVAETETNADCIVSQTETIADPHVTIDVDGTLCSQTDHQVSIELASGLTEVLHSENESDSMGALTLDETSGPDTASSFDLCSESTSHTEAGVSNIDAHNLDEGSKIDLEESETRMDNTGRLNDNDLEDMQEGIEYQMQHPSVSQVPEHYYGSGEAAGGEELNQLLDREVVSQEEANTDISYEFVEEGQEHEFDDGGHVGNEVNAAEVENDEEVDDVDAEDNIDGEGETDEFGGEEEESDEGEDMGEEVEVEIQDCSDTEMEQDGGITYIITEGMIVVEENESSEAYQDADGGAAVEEERGMCDEQISNVQKTKRIVIKVPSSKSLNDVEFADDVEASNVQKIVGDVAKQSSPERLVSICSGQPPTAQQELVPITSETMSEEINNTVETSGKIVSDNENSVAQPDDTCKQSNVADSIHNKDLSDQGENPNATANPQEEAKHKCEEENLSEDAIGSNEFSASEDVIGGPEKVSDLSKTTSTSETVEISLLPSHTRLDLNVEAKDSNVTDEEVLIASSGKDEEPVKRLDEKNKKESSKELPVKPSSEKRAAKLPKESLKQPKKDKDKAQVKPNLKPVGSTSHKLKKQGSQTNAAEGTPSSTKSTRKPDTVSNPVQLSKPDVTKKTAEAKEVATRSFQSDNQHTSKKSSSSKKQLVASNHRTRSNSVTSKEALGKEKEGNNKKDNSSKNSPATTNSSDDQQSTGKTNPEGKVALRSSRSRKSSDENRAADSQGSSSKKEKVKIVTETPVKPRQSERVCKATEKAIASGFSSKRRTTAVESSLNLTEKHPVSNLEEEGSSQRRGKRKADLSPPSGKEETPGSKRRTTRSSETPVSNETSHSLRSARKGKGLKRKNSSSDLPPAKLAHTSETLREVELEKEFIAGIQQMCRICGSKSDNLLNVFGPEGRTMQLAEKVHNILPLKMREDEPLPSGVCHSCVVTLIACEKLVEKCSSIDKRLRIHFNCPVDEPSKDKASRQTEASKPEKSSVKVSTKSDELLNASADESSSKLSSVTRSSSRVSAQAKQIETTHKSHNASHASAKTVSSEEGKESSTAKKRNVLPNSEVEDSPPVLEAEPPQSHLPLSNQEPSAQPPVLVPQPGKPLPGLVPIPAEDPSNAMKRFGNTYGARMKQGQWEKIERGLEAIHGEQSEDDVEGASDIKPFGERQTEEFHIVDLDMNVEEVQPETERPATMVQTPSGSMAFLIEIPAPAEDENAALSSSPKSVVDSILVEWSGDEEEIIPDHRPNTSGGRKDTVNGKPAVVSKGPCLFGDDEEGDVTSKPKSKISTVVKQESFWPEPEPGMSNTQTAEKQPSDVPWKCFVCGKRGKSVSKFLEHKKLHLNDRKLVSCPKCSESFSNMGLLKSHMKAHHGDDDEDEVVERQVKQSRRRAAPAAKPEDTVVDVDLTPAVDGLYHCSLCQSSFTTIGNLCQHKLIHQKNDVAVYKCTVCRRAFFQFKDYEDHMVSHQTGALNQGKFQCAKCDIRVSSQKEFLDHINNAHAPENFVCDMCSKSFDTRHKLRSHRSTVHKSTAYACHLCDKVCQKRITLVEHLRKHTGDNPFACPVCNKRFNRLANFKAHMTIHENARRYECPYCGKRFNRQSIQQRHIKTHTNEQSRKHRCRVCNLTFNVATEMYTHRKLHTREEVERANWEDEKMRMALTTFPCKVCQTPFNTVEEVLSHMPFHTDDERDIAVKLKNPRLECDICGKFLNSKRTFNAHRSSHIDGKPFVCKICSKGYSTSTGLNYHMLSHTGERPFPCSFCNKGYKNSTDLKVHMRQHTGEFPYKCNQCNKAFRSASSLQKHGFVHTEARPFKCQFCKMAFKREGTKMNHERIHTNDRRFKCKICTKTFIQKGACDAHEKLHFRGGSQIYMTLSDSLIDITLPPENSDKTSTDTTSGTEKHELFDDFEEEDFEEDDDDEEEYIIYEDDSVEDEENDGKEEEEEEISLEAAMQGEGNDPSKSEESSFVEPSKCSNGVDLSTTNITPIPISVSSDTVPSVGDSSVHITIL